MKMTLEYKIANTSSLNSEDIIKRIVLIIAKRKYGILSVTDSSVEFDDHSGGIIGNWEYVSRIKKGKFKILKNGDSNIVTFDYLPIPMSEYIWVAIICSLPIGFAIINKVYAASFIFVLFIAQLVFKRYNLRNVAHEMLKNVVS
jgi:hypothetical protein